jgi:isoleucyl-tRNA synthetase
MNKNCKETRNLSRADFPMKANLATREPEVLFRVARFRT